MNKKRILLVGGGSGGHLTPLVAVADSIKKINESITTCHVGQRGENLDEVTKHRSIDESYIISAGKFRRYHGESRFKQLLDIQTFLLNTRDVFRFARGTIQSYFLLRKIKPTAIFLKGGFVSVPIGFAARALKIPYVTHDSDAIPGLANRMTAAHAIYNLTALPIELYPYNQQKTKQVGVPIRKEFKKVNRHDVVQARQELAIPTNAKVIVIVGGGLGAKVINDAVISSSDRLLQSYAELFVIHITGKSLYDEVVEGYHQVLDGGQLARVKIIDFSTTLHTLSASADIIITRAGATNIAEFAIQAKPCIVIPAPHLTGGQQLHNAAVLEETNSAIIVQESNIQRLSSAAEDLLQHPEKCQLLSNAIHQLAVRDADDKIANIVLTIQK